MKTAHYLIAGLALATAGAAFAAEQDTASRAGASASQSAGQAPAQSQATAKRALTRAEVQAQVIEARRNGTLIETEADMDVAQPKNQR